MAEEHNWTEEDDIVAFYLSHCQGTRFLGIGEGTIASILSKKPPSPGYSAVRMPDVSLVRRVQNFNYLAGKPNGLANYAKQSSLITRSIKIITLQNCVL